MNATRVVQKMQKEGRPTASYRRVRYFLDQGRLGQVPYDASGCRDFGPEHIERLRKELDSPKRRPGKRPRSERNQNQ